MNPSTNPAKNLVVFPTRRALNDFYLKHSEALKSSETKSSEAFLPEARTIEQFFDEIVLVAGKARLNRALRAILLWSALQEAKNIAIEKIGFERAFLRFLERSSFLFGFFDELKSAQISIQNIDARDTYGDYADHLRVLSLVYAAYTARLAALNLYDTPEEYALHTPFLRYFETIKIHVDGVLSPIEMAILREAAAHTEIELIFERDKFNKFIFDKILPKPVGEGLESGFKYIFSVNKNEITQKIKIAANAPKIELYGFSLRINQVALVIAKVNEWLEEGCENIAVVLPAEDFTRYLELFDWARNLNYAMGARDLSLKKSIEALKIELENGGNPFEGESGGESRTAESSGKPRGGESHCESHGESAKNPAKTSKLERVLAYLERLDKSEIDGLSSGWVGLSGEFEALGYGEILDFVLQNLQNKDDTSGGKVRVLGVLETRGMSFERVIIVDCNAEFLPNISDSDFFLNSAIRARSGLPTLNEKANLQLSFYHRLIKNADIAALSFCRASLHSSLIDDLGLDAQSAIEGESKWQLSAQNLGESGAESGANPHANPAANPQPNPYPKPHPKPYLEEDFVGAFDPARTLSASSLGQFLKCPRAFYFAKIQNLGRDKDATKPLGGTEIHDFLKELGSDFSPKNRAKVLEEFAQKFALSGTKRLDLEVWLRRLEKFFAAQSAALENGREILAREWAFRTRIFGFDFEGRIDRVDRLPSGEIRVIDYKTKDKFDKKKEGVLQLALYKLALEAEFGGAAGLEASAKSSAAAHLGSANPGLANLSWGANLAGAKISAAYCDLCEEDDEKREILMEEAEERDALEALRGACSELSGALGGGEIRFAKTESRKECNFCDFKYLCDRF